MKYHAGPHKRRGRRRRALKALIIPAVLAALLLAASPWMVRQPPEQPGGLCEQELAVARTLYEISGDNGFAHEYLKASSPEQAAYIRGEAAP